MVMVSGHLLTWTVAGKEMALFVWKVPSLPVTTVIFLLALSVIVTVAPDTKEPPVPLVYTVPAAVKILLDWLPPET